MTETIAGRATSSDGDGVAVVALEGDIDLANSDQIAEGIAKVIDAGPVTSVVLDLTSVDFIDSTGLRMLWEVRQTAQDASAILVLRAPSVAVMRLLKLTGMHRIFQIEEEPT